jgi:hypothetical protein
MVRSFVYCDDEMLGITITITIIIAITIAIITVFYSLQLHFKPTKPSDIRRWLLCRRCDSFRATVKNCNTLFMYHESRMVNVWCHHIKRCRHLRCSKVLLASLQFLNCSSLSFLYIALRFEKCTLVANEPTSLFFQQFVERFLRAFRPSVFCQCCW